MKIPSLKITKPLDLGAYDERLRGQVIQVWVNLPKKYREIRLRLLRANALYIKTFRVYQEDKSKDKNFIRWLVASFRLWQLKRERKQIDENMRAFFSRLWSQHEDPETRCSVQDVKRLSNEEPALLEWMMKESVLLVDAFAADKKK